ncbi:eukaryotic translation initiation factor 5B [Hanseniaspora vineae]
MAKKGKKNAPNYWDEEVEEDQQLQDQPQDLGTEPTSAGSEVSGAESASASVSASVEPETAGADDIESDFMSTLKKSKNKKKNNNKKNDDEEGQDNGGKPVLKSKKEKEKEKKEREKQKKKEQAAKKKAAGGAKNNDQSDKKNGAANKDKKDAETQDSGSASTSAPSKPKKKVPAGLAALRKQLELQKQYDEQERLAREEEERLEKEEEERAAKELAQKEEEKKLKKEKEKARKERLKAEGKLLTRKQKEEKKLLERRRAALLAAGNIKVAALEKANNGEDAADQESKKPKKVVYGKKKKKSKEELEAEQLAKKAAEEAAKKEAENAEGEEDELVDDWEALLSGEEEEEQGEEASAVEETPKEETKAKAEAPKAPRITPKPAAIDPKYDLYSAAANASRTKPKGNKELRSPICCILGHVDTGKTKLLDKIRQTNVQGGEAGGITQQIGATYFPIEAIQQKTAVMAEYEEQTFDVPGLLVIDTPGHESFTNLRSRGSSLCNIAILVIDIMHGLEQQTLESIRLLRDRKAPFVVALNKIDRLYDWQTIPNNSFRDSFEKQTRSVKQEFEKRFNEIKVALAEQGLNSELYFQNKNMSKFVSIVPTSAVTGEGVPDLLWLLLELTQKRMSKQLKYVSNEIEATVLEVKVVEGFGTTIDVILSNGKLKEGDRIVLCGLNGPIVTNIRALLTPQPLRELRLKSEYVHHKEVSAALGVKIAANDLEKAVSGSRLLVVQDEEDEEDMMEDVMDDLTGLLDSVDNTGKGVVVQASTLGSLEALLDFLKDMKIPVMSIGLGPVFKRDVMKCGTMLEKAPEYAVMLCFDVKVDKEAEHYAEEQGIKIFNAEVIYHLFDAFTAYQKELNDKKREEYGSQVVFPCVLNTIQIINKRGPMIIGVDVMEGTLRIGTPICAVKVDPATKQRQVLPLGKVASLEINHESVADVKRGQTNAGVAMRLDDPSSQQPIWGRHVDEKDTLYSMISRRSIDTLKDPLFRDQVPKTDWLLIKKLKPTFGID